jgi:hypothetical protein
MRAMIINKKERPKFKGGWKNVAYIHEVPVKKIPQDGKFVFPKRPKFPYGLFLIIVLIALFFLSNKNVQDFFSR